MKKLVFLSVGMLALLVQSASAQVLMTTTNDFHNWYNDGGTMSPSSAWDYDGSTVNGLGNAEFNPGGVGTAGSLELSWSSGTWGPIGQLIRPGYPDFLHAIDPGSIAAWSAESGYGPGTLTAHSGVLKLVYTLPDNNGGSFFQIGVGFNYDGNWNDYWDSGSTYLGTIGGLEAYQATIPYTINARPGNLSYFNVMIMRNSDYAPIFPFYVDQIEVVPEPTSMALIGMSALAFGFFARRRS